MPNAVPLGQQAASTALAQAQCSPTSITHLVTVSCTGAESPGIDHQLIDLLGISPNVSRTHIGFMGCHAAINALAMGSAFVRADPQSVVLVVCIELCSLHLQVGKTSQGQQTANAIFSDGAAAAVVGSRTGLCKITDFASQIFPGTKDLMGWDIGDNGFQITLSPRVPVVIKRYISGWVDQWLSTHRLQSSDVTGWAVHPGGRDILEGVQKGLGLPDDSMAHSHRVLNQHGNMSSATTLWVLSELLQEVDSGPIVGLAFGPGLTGEAILLNR